MSIRVSGTIEGVYTYVGSDELVTSFQDTYEFYSVDPSTRVPTLLGTVECAGINCLSSDDIGGGGNISINHTVQGLGSIITINIVGDIFPNATEFDMKVIPNNYSDAYMNGRDYVYVFVIVLTL